MREPRGLNTDDQHNRALLRNVRPPDWANPEPASRYNLVVVGGGTAGLVSAAGAAALGARVALVERDLLGGDCLNTGCVPSKGLIRAGRAAADVRAAATLGIGLSSPPRIDFPEVMTRVRRLRADISRHDSAARFRDLGVDVFLGDARFVSRNAVEVGERRLRFRKAVIATGARATIPAIDGLREAGFLTNESVFDLTELPARLAIVGGGPLGCELAQAFARLGSRVTLLEMMPRFLPRADPDAAEILAESLRRDGVEIRLNARLEAVVRRPAGKQLSVSVNDAGEELEVDELLIGIGRSPNVDGLGLEQAGVAHDPRTGVEVDDRLRTTNSRIYAAGDVCLRHKLTHMADASARIVLQNALFPGRKKLSALTVPWSIYTSPEVAHVGLDERAASRRGVELDTYRVEMADVDRAILESEDEGFVKIHVRRGTDKIAGATVVGEHAGEMISEITLAIDAGVGLNRLSAVIHPYPTRADAIRKAADEYRRTRLTPSLGRWLRRWFAFSR